MPADALVLAGTQEQFLANTRPWTHRNLGETAYYISILRTGGNAKRRDRILSTLGQRHDVTLVATNGMAQVYLIKPPAAPTQ